VSGRSLHIISHLKLFRELQLVAFSLPFARGQFTQRIRVIHRTVEDRCAPTLLEALDFSILSLYYD